MRVETLSLWRKFVGELGCLRVHGMCGISYLGLLPGCMSARFTSASDRADDGGVDHLLRSAPVGANCNKFDALVIRDWRIDVHVCQADIASDAGTGFLANARNGRQCQRSDRDPGSL